MGLARAGGRLLLGHGRLTSPSSLSRMNYLTDLEQKLIPMLRDLSDKEIDAIVSLVKDAVLESYRNGIDRGKRGDKPRKPAFVKTR